MRSIVVSVVATCLSACVFQAVATPQATPATGASSGNVVAAGSPSVKVDADKETVLRGVQMIEDGKPQAAIDGPLNEVIGKFEAKYPDPAGKIYSARSTTESLVYLLEAAKEKRNAQVLGPAWSMAYWARGYAYGEMGRYDDELAELEKALVLSPKDPQYNNELAFVLMQRHQPGESLARYEEAEGFAEFAPNGEKAHFQCASLRGQGYALVELHRLDEAEAKYRACLAITPNEPKSLGEIGYIQQQRKKLQQAQ